MPPLEGRELEQTMPAFSAELQVQRECARSFETYVGLRKQQPMFSNARSSRNALDRARLRQANRLMAEPDKDVTTEDLMTIDKPDIMASRVFAARGDKTVGSKREHERANG